MTKALIINSNHTNEVLPWCSCKIKDVYDFLIAEGEDVEIIEEGQANPELLKTYIDAHPELERIYGLGHGSATTFTVTEEAPFISTVKNLDLVENRVVHLLSCLTALELGYAIAETAIAYFGYKRSFWLPIETLSDPCSCRFLTAVFAGDVQLEHSIYYKRDYETCISNAIQTWNDEIAYWEEHYDEESIPLTAGGETSITEEMAEVLIDFMISNRDALTLYTEETSHPPSITAHIVTLLSMATLGGMIISKSNLVRY